MASTVRASTGPRTILVRDGVGAAGHIVQRTDTTSHRVVVAEASLILVEDGKKRIRWAGGECVASPGEAIALQAGEVVDIQNALGRSGTYRALWICWAPELLEASAPRGPRVALQASLGEDFLASYHRAFDALDETTKVPARVATSRLREVLLWLEARGFHFRPAPASLGQEVRRLLATDPAAAWSMERVAHATATSIPTLRRKLAGEGVVFRDLVQDVRMAHALTLLQNTDTPVLSVALATGYASASRFTARFRARFGFLPTDLRGQNRGRSRA